MSTRFDLDPRGRNSYNSASIRAGGLPDIPSRPPIDHTMKPLIAVLVAVLAAMTCGCKTQSLLWGDSQSPPASRSDYRPPALPPDGAWVRYRSTSEETTEKVKGKFKLRFEGKDVEKEYTVRRSELITLSFVGSVIEDQEPCRWVEIKIENTDDNKVTLYKMLLKEKAFFDKKGALASGNVVRTWQRKHDGTIEKRDKPPGYSFLFLWTPGGMKTVSRSGDPMDIEYQSGRLAGAQPWTVKDSETSRPIIGLIKARSIGTSTVWTHPELPVGYARLHSSSEMLLTLGWTTQIKNSTVIDHTLDDAGAEAQSELPDCN
jgi:hypothetical protein